MEPKLTLHASLEEIGPEAWNALVPSAFPFAGYAFLHALEASGSVGPETGWQPLYLALRHDDRLEAACYLYVKSHSFGEFVFDWSWANAYQQHGVPYYPKLVAAVPFTPVTGPKFLVRPAAVGAPELRRRLSGAVDAVLERLGASSVHSLFVTGEERDELAARGHLVRHGFQFHWPNRGYRDFDDFLETLKSRKRKAIRKERAEVLRSGLELVTLTGADIGAEEARAMADFYDTTAERHGGTPYLTPRFFEVLFTTMRDALVLTMARRQGRWVAGALHVRGGDRLYGRHWGATAEHRHLHFELCYYRALDWAMANGVTVVEAGAQGEHKIQRGFLPTLTYSTHSLRHPAFRAAIADFLEREKAAIGEAFKQWEPQLPYALE